MRNEQIRQITTEEEVIVAQAPRRGFVVRRQTRHSAVFGYTEGRAAGDIRLSSAACLDRPHVDDTPCRSERRKIGFARLTNTFGRVCVVFC